MRYRGNNEEKIKEYQQKPEVIIARKEYQKEYDYKPKNKSRRNNSRKQRRKIDKDYLIKERIRSNFYLSLKKYSITGKVMSTSKYLDMDAIIKHLTPFPDLLLYEVDHIIPLKRFNHDDPEQIRRAWLPSNLQWLPKEINRWKSDRLIIPMTEEQKEKLLKELQKS